MLRFSIIPQHREAVRPWRHRKASTLRLPLAITGDVLLLASLMLLGGDFRDKLQETLISDLAH